MKFAVSMLDLVSNLMFVYLAFAEVTIQSVADAVERSLPTVTLTESQGQGVSSSAAPPVPVTVHSGEAGRPRFFIGKDEVSFDQLKPALAKLTPSSVVLRIDEELPTGLAIKLMALLHELHVGNITFAYKAPMR